MLIGNGTTQGKLTEQDIRGFFKKAAEEKTFDDKKVLAVFPDHTRSGPVPIFFKAFCDILGPRTKKLDFMIALGTHPPMTNEMIEEHFGITKQDRIGKYKDFNIFNHTWDKSEENIEVGRLLREDVKRISNGLLDEDVRVSVNKKVNKYDLIAICGPVFPHEVVGFSGGNKYLFPGISEAEIINFFHWLGALMTNPKIIGNKYTAVREVVEMCAAMVKPYKHAFCYVVNKGDIAGVYIDEVKSAWSAAADLSDKLHITYKDRFYHTVLSCAPKMYDDIWTGGKCMYKMESVVEDGGKLIIYAPHIDEISYTHGKVLDKIGYHTKDYFIKQMDKFEDMPKGVMAHSTHVKGIGTYENGVEKPRINVCLATKIPKERCEKVNLGYIDPDTINIDDYKDKEDEGVLYVPKAGEMLYKVKNGPDWQK